MLKITLKLDTDGFFRLPAAANNFPFYISLCQEGVKEYFPHVGWARRIEVKVRNKRPHCKGYRALIIGNNFDEWKIQKVSRSGRTYFSHAILVSSVLSGLIRIFPEDSKLWIQIKVINEN